VSFDCTQLPSAFDIPTQTGASACAWYSLWFSAQHSSHTDIGFAPPASGTVTELRIAAGPVTGPMRVVVERDYFRQTGDAAHPFVACCVRVGQTRDFTPATSAVSTIPVRLQMREDPTPPVEDTQTIANYDFLMLAVLEDGVPIPLHDTGQRGADVTAPTNFYYATATPSQSELEQPANTVGFVVTMNGEWQPASGAAVRPRTASPLSALPAGPGVVPGPLRPPEISLPFSFPGGA
jgi:hypothetical protein